MRFNFIIGMFVMLMSILMLSAFMPTISSSFNKMKGSDNFNCVGYVDPAGLHSYNSSLAANTNDLGCTVAGFAAGIYVLAVIFGLIAGTLTGDLGRDEQMLTQQY